MRLPRLTARREAGTAGHCSLAWRSARGIFAGGGVHAVAAGLGSRGISPPSSSPACVGMRALVGALFLAFFATSGCDTRIGGSRDVPEEEGEEVAVLPEDELIPEEIPEPDPNDDRSVEQRLRDASLAAHVRIALVEERRLRAYEIETEAENGVVRLRGHLPSTEAAELAEQIAGVVRGVREVENLTEVPASEVVDARADRRAEDLAQSDLPAQDESTEPVRSEPAAPAQAEATAPVRAEPSAPAQEQYTVRSGDSLWEIARRHDTTVEAIKRLNNLSGDRVKPGQQLRVR